MVTESPYSQFKLHPYDQKVPCIAEMTPEVAAELFYNGELELELKRIGLEDYRFKMDSDRESCFERVDEVRRASVYPHPSNQCSPGCRGGYDNIVLYVSEPSP